jgi:hypothetical protein
MAEKALPAVGHNSLEDLLFATVSKKNTGNVNLSKLPGQNVKRTVCNLNFNPVPNQCCGSGSGIRYLFDPWIRDG